MQVSIYFAIIYVVPRHESPTPHTSPDHASLKRAVDALPSTDTPRSGLSESARLAVLAMLNNNGSVLPSAIVINDQSMLMKVTRELEPVPGHDKTYVITEEQLRGTIAMATIAGSTAVVHAIGASLEEAQRLERMFEDHSTPPTAA